MPALSWQTVVIGDPLCAPFRQRAVDPQDIDPGIDATTELPAFLSARRLDALAKTGIASEVAKLFVKSEVRLSKGNRAGAKEALEKATEIDDGFIAGHLVLAGLDEIDSLWDAAIDRYRRILNRQPNHLMALNNLAYGLTEHKNSAAEALPFAERAYALGQRAPSIADTLAWTYHRLHRDAEAEPILAAAIVAEPNAAEVQLHAAIVFQAAGKRDAALRALQAATKLNRQLEDRDDVQELRTRLGVPKQARQ
jgi:Tfp pilus assembly protein PilF